MPTHDSNDIAVRFKVFRECIIDCVIVQSGGERVEQWHVLAARPLRRPLVDLRVECRSLERACLARNPPTKQFTLGIELRPIGVEGQVRQPREHDCPRGEHVLQRGGGQARSQEGSASTRDRLDHIRTQREVDPLHDEPVEGPARIEDSVELLE